RYARHGGTHHHPIRMRPPVQRPTLVPWHRILDCQVTEDRTPLFWKDVEVRSRKPCHSLEISDEIVALLLIFKIHLVRLCRIEHVTQGTGLVLTRQLVSEHRRPEKLRKWANVSDV